MKKLLTVLLASIIGYSTVLPASAFGDTDRKVIKNAKINDVQEIVVNLIKDYDGVVTPKEMNLKEHRFIVNYNSGTPLNALGINKKDLDNKTFCKAIFSCKLKEINNGQDVLITNTKHSNTFLFWSTPTFRHYRKLYKELQFNGYEISKYQR